MNIIGIANQVKSAAPNIQLHPRRAVLNVGSHVAHVDDLAAGVIDTGKIMTIAPSPYVGESHIVMAYVVFETSADWYPANVLVKAVR